jgi:transcriptional regulator with XRE-family HTH domain
MQKNGACWRPCVGWGLSQAEIARQLGRHQSTVSRKLKRNSAPYVEQIGLVKMDILAQGGLAVIRDALALLHERGITPDLENLAPSEDAEIWKMIATGNARGVHHIESPAMISLARMCNGERSSARYVRRHRMGHLLPDP